MILFISMNTLRIGVCRTWSTKEEKESDRRKFMTERKETEAIIKYQVLNRRTYLLERLSIERKFIQWTYVSLRLRKTSLSLEQNWLGMRRSELMEKDKTERLQMPIQKIVSIKITAMSDWTVNCRTRLNELSLLVFKYWTVKTLKYFYKRIRWFKFRNLLVEGSRSMLLHRSATLETLRPHRSLEPVVHYHSGIVYIAYCIAVKSKYPSHRLHHAVLVTVRDYKIQGISLYFWCQDLIR